MDCWLWLHSKAAETRIRRGQFENSAPDLRIYIGSDLFADEHFSCFKQEKEKIFFSENDEFSISIQYFESNDVTGDQRTGVGYGC